MPGRGIPPNPGGFIVRYDINRATQDIPTRKGTAASVGVESVPNCDDGRIFKIPVDRWRKVCSMFITNPSIRHSKT